MKRVEIALVSGGFVLLTVFLTWPQIRGLGTEVGTHYDSLFSIWRLGWIAHALATRPAHLFDANIFYPERGTLAYSDALLLPGLLGAPFIWAGVNEVVVYNLEVLLSFVACGLAMYGLVRYLTRSPIAASFAGAVFTFQPYRFAHFDHFELLLAWPVPLALCLFDRLISGRRTRDGWLLGLTLALQAWSSVYYFIFLVTALAVVSAGMLIGRRVAEWRALLRPALAAAFVAAVLVAPYAAVYARATRTIGLRRPQDVAEWSPSLGNYLIATPGNWIYGARFGTGGQEMTLFPGIVAIVMAIAGLVPPIDRRRVAYLITALVVFELSLGVHGVTGGWVFTHVWIYRGLRVPARMYAIVSTMIAILGGYGVARLVSAGGAWRRGAGGALVAAALLESAAVPLPLMTVDRKPPRLYAWLRGQPTSPVMDWPLPKPASLGYTRTPWYMYDSTFHWQPLVEGYSGFYPDSYILLLEAMDSFPSKSSIEYLRRDGVKFVLLHSEGDPGAYVRARNALGASTAFELVRDERVAEGEIALYRLKP